jgi:hypothetical protein
MCESLSAQLIVRVTNEPGGGCVQNEYVQVQVPSDVDEYEAVWYATIGEGTRWWDQSDATVGPASVTGEGASYQVPVGDAAWSAAGGASAAGDCSGGPPSGTYGVAAWGVPSTGCAVAAAAAGERPVASVAKHRHCTTTAVRCVHGGANVGSVDDPRAFVCGVFVTDNFPRRPTPPTGRAPVTFDWIVTSGYSGGPQHKSLSCPLRAYSKSSSVCIFHPPTTPSNTTMESVTVTGLYPGDTDHNPSGPSATNLNVALTIPVRPTTAAEKQLLKSGASVEDILAKVGGLGVLIGKVDPKWLAAETGLKEAAVADLLNYLAAWYAGQAIGTAIVSFEADHLDPADLGYRVIARPRAIAIPRVPSLPHSVAAPTRAWLTNMLKARAIEQALGTTQNRASTAFLVRDHKALRRQMKVAKKYFVELANLTLGDIRLAKQIAARLTSAHLNRLTLAVPTNDTAGVQRMERSSPPSYLLRLLISGGKTRHGAIAAWRALAHDVKPGKTTINLSMLLTDPQLIADEREVAAIFRAHAASL